MNTQKQKTTYNFIGTVTAVSPLTVTLPGGNTKGAHRLPRNGGYHSRPYFPASSVRGALRNAGHVALTRHLGKQDVRFTIAEHFAHAQGIIIKAKGVESCATDEPQGAIDANQSVRDDNPFMSLWGRWGMDGRCCIGNLIPLTDDCVGQFGGGARTVMFERNPNLLEDLSNEEIQQINHILSEQAETSANMAPLSAEVTTLKKSLKNIDDPEAKSRVQSKIAELEAQMKQMKDDKTGSRESIRRPIDPYEAFVAGCEFEHLMTLKSATDDELSLFLTCLLEFARGSTLGGHKAHGCGSISGEYKVTVWPEDALKPVEIGSVSFGPNGFEVTGEVLESAIGRWRSADFDFKTC